MYSLDQMAETRGERALNRMDAPQLAKILRADPLADARWAAKYESAAWDLPIEVREVIGERESLQYAVISAMEDGIRSVDAAACRLSLPAIKCDEIAAAFECSEDPATCAAERDDGTLDDACWNLAESRRDYD